MTEEEGKQDAVFTVSTEELDKDSIVEDFKKLKGVGESRALKLIDAGYTSLSMIAIADLRDFVDRTGLPKGSAEQLITNARGLIGIGEFENLEELEEDEKNLDYLTTGSSMIDELLCGGIPTGLITEVHALNGVGKTQFCLTAAVNATQPKEKGGLDCHVLYVDAENTFSAKRALQIARERGYDVSEVAKRIHCVRASNSAHQILLMDKINEEATKYPVRLLIVDSLIAHFRAEYVGRGALSERQQQLNHYISQLKAFAIANNAVVLVTNQMMSNPDAMSFVPNIPAGGNVVGHACAVRLGLRRGQQEKRVCKLEKHPAIPTGEAVCKLSERGIIDL